MAWLAWPLLTLILGFGLHLWTLGSAEAIWCQEQSAAVSRCSQTDLLEVQPPAMRAEALANFSSDSESDGLPPPLVPVGSDISEHGKEETSSSGTGADEDQDIDVMTKLAKMIVLGDSSGLGQRQREGALASSHLGEGLANGGSSSSAAPTSQAAATSSSPLSKGKGKGAKTTGKVDETTGKVDKTTDKVDKTTGKKTKRRNRGKK